MASSKREQAQGLYDALKERFPDIDEELAVGVYEWAKGAVVRLEKVDTVEAKISMLMTAVYYAAVNGHEYGSPASNPDMKRLLEDLQNCRRQEYLDALTYEDCNLILQTAKARRPDDGM
jgi:hypothetical protein